MGSHCHYGQTWIHHYDLETKEQSKQWKHSGSLRPKRSADSDITQAAECYIPTHLQSNRKMTADTICSGRTGFDAIFLLCTKLNSTEYVSLITSWENGNVWAVCTLFITGKGHYITVDTNIMKDAMSLTHSLKPSWLCSDKPISRTIDNDVRFNGGWTEMNGF